MNPVLGGAIIAAFVVLLSTLWQFGGRRAAERRAIREELEILNAMPVTMTEREALAERVESAIAEYLREPEPALQMPPPFVDRAMYIGFGTIGTALVTALVINGGNTDKKVPIWLTVVIVAGMATAALPLAGMLLWALFTSIWRTVRRVVSR